MLANLTAIVVAASIQVAPSFHYGPMATASRVESVESERTREAVAYANPLPPGAPQEDYPLVAWCEALVSGHVETGESLTNPDELDREIMRLGRLEAADFRSALTAARPRVDAALQAQADAAVENARAKWSLVLANPDEASRSQVFGLFYGLPGRCEHAARRIRADVRTAPAALKDVGLEP